MRKHDRYDSSIPIRIFRNDLTESFSSPLINISLGGLSCHFGDPITLGDSVKIQIKTTEPPCDLSGEIRWCRKFKHDYEVGIEFNQDADPFLTRMVKQICRIEHYRQELKEKEGKELSSEEAAKEWIEKFAHEFPH